MKFSNQQELTLGRESPPTRGAWIEIQTLKGRAKGKNVAPHTGGVD